MDGSTVRRGLARPGRREGGAAAVEFALLVTLLLALVFGIIQYGYYFYQRQQASFALREGARVAAVGTKTCAELKTYVRERVPSRARNSVVVTVDYPAPVVVGSEASVTVTFPAADFKLPFIPWIGGRTITEDAVTRVENVTANTVDCS